MVSTTPKSAPLNLTVTPSEVPLEDKINFYQISELHKEIDCLKRRLSLIPKPVEIVCKRMHELWWSITSLLGLGYLHDGSRVKAQAVTANPTITLPKISPQAMPAPRLFLDITATYKSTLNTGVQRVIRELCRQGETDGALAPVIIEHGQFVTVPNLAPLVFQAGDRLLLMDSSWTLTSQYPQALNSAKSQSAEIILGIYDLIPLQHPGFVQPHFTALFDEWLRTITPYCTSALAISKFSAESFLSWMRENSDASGLTSVGWFHLGADFPDMTITNNPNVRDFDKIKSDYILSVGTIEPRKGYSVALDAFDQLWREGSNLSYVIIGRHGDLALHLIERITHHPLYGIKLFWPQNVDDRLLALFYKNSIGVIIPAMAEGFGLPLIEASFHGKPIIASDLPVFKEIAGSDVIFFSTANSKDLAHKIKNDLASGVKSTSPHISDWAKATQDMLKIVKTNSYQIH